MTSISLVDGGRRQVGPDLSCGPLAFGTWRFTHADRTTAGRSLDAALDAGLDLVDAADVYGFDWGGSGFGSVEALLGEVLAADPRRRGRLVLATKGGIDPGTPYDSSADYLRNACEASLRRLRVDVIDLYQVHRPDLLTSHDEVADTLASLVSAGTVRAVGISNHTPAQHDALRSALAARGIPLATTQPELSVLALDPLRDGTLDRCQTDHVVPLAWSPLAGGRLVTGEGVPSALVTVLDDLARREGVDQATIAVAFVLCLPGRPVAIVGSQRPERLAAAPDALGVHLDRADLYRLIEASEGIPLP